MKYVEQQYIMITGMLCPAYSLFELNKPYFFKTFNILIMQP